MTTVQQEIDFTDRRENNPESNAILQQNKDKLNRQCRFLLELLLRGEKVTVRSGMVDYGIGDVRRRIKDLRDAGYKIVDKVMEGGFKEYFIQK